MSFFFFFFQQAIFSHFLFHFLNWIVICSVLDDQMADLIMRICKDESFKRPVHLNMCLSRDTSFEDLVEVNFIHIHH